LPRGQRTLLTLVLRKLLASSPVAVAGTLERMVQRLEPLSNGHVVQAEQQNADSDHEDDGPLVDQEDLEEIADLVDEMADDDGELDEQDPALPASPAEKAHRLAQELDELRGFINQAHSITHD